MKKRLVIFFLAAAMVLCGCENKNSKLYKKGIEALEQKDYVTSIAMLEGAVKAGDRVAESYRSLGIAYLKSQEYDKAKEAFKTKAFTAPKPVQQFGTPKGGKLPYGVGDRVKHIKFGEGSVTAITEGGRDYEVTVDFDGPGTKKMFAAFARLQKV